MSDATPLQRPDAREIAERLKERIYVTFTSLAVVLALLSHGETTAVEALVSLLIAVLGTLLAVIVADVLARVTANERLLSRQELAHVLSISLGAFGAVVVPIILLSLSIAGVWDPSDALLASAFALLLALVVISYLAVRRARLSWWKRGLFLVAEAAVGLVVLALELLAHG